MADPARQQRKTIPMTEAQPATYRSAALSHRKPTRFRLAPDAAARAALAASLDLIDLPELLFEG